MSEPSFTKYMGAYKGKLGKPDLFTSDISGIEENVDRVGDVAYLASPVPMAPFAKGIPYLFKAGKAAKEGTENIVKDVVKSFTQGDSGFRASAGGKKGTVVCFNSHVAHSARLPRKGYRKAIHLVVPGPPAKEYERKPHPIYYKEFIEE